MASTAVMDVLLLLPVREWHSRGGACRGGSVVRGGCAVRGGACRGGCVVRGSGEAWLTHAAVISEGPWGDYPVLLLLLLLLQVLWLRLLVIMSLLLLQVLWLRLLVIMSLLLLLVLLQ